MHRINLKAPPEINLETTHAKLLPRSHNFVSTCISKICNWKQTLNLYIYYFCMYTRKFNLTLLTSAGQQVQLLDAYMQTRKFSNLHALQLQLCWSFAYFIHKYNREKFHGETAKERKDQESKMTKS